MAKGERHGKRDATIVGVAGLVLGGIIGCYLCSKCPPPARPVGPCDLGTPGYQKEVVIWAPQTTLKAGGPGLTVQGFASGWVDGAQFIIWGIYPIRPLGSSLGDTPYAADCEFTFGLQSVFALPGTVTIWLTDASQTIKSNVLTFTVTP